MGKSMTVEIDGRVYQELERLVRERGTPLEAAVAEAIEAYLKQEKAYMNDPFFQIGKAGRSGLGDLAEAHDKYLYGTKEKIVNV